MDSCSYSSKNKSNNSIYPFDKNIIKNLGKNITPSLISNSTIICDFNLNDSIFPLQFSKNITIGGLKKLIAEEIPILKGLKFKIECIDDSIRNADNNAQFPDIFSEDENLTLNIYPEKD